MLAYQRLYRSSYTNILLSHVVVLLLTACSNKGAVNANECGNQGANSANGTSNEAPTTTPVTLTAIGVNSGVRVITQAELLAHANDVNGDALTATGLTISSGNGTLVDNGNGSWNHTPALNDDTGVSFSYCVTNGALAVTGAASMDIMPLTGSGDITLSWVAPVAREDESPISLSDISGYRVYYGTMPGVYPIQVIVNDGSADHVTLNDMSPGTYYFVLTTVDSGGRESSYSDIIVFNI